MIGFRRHRMRGGMIRKSTDQDYKKLADLWLEASRQGHYFISSEHWEKLADKIWKHYLPLSNTFVFEDKHKIKGFISLLDNNYIGALFVHPQYQRQKIGTKLLRYIRRRRPNMQLKVFIRNVNALAFYQKHGFRAVAESTDEETGEAELLMAWAQGCFSGCKKVFVGDS